VLPGDQVVADFSIRNLGDGTARTVTANVASSHPGLEFVDAGSSRGSCNVSAAMISCQLGDLAADSAADVTVGLLGTALGQGTVTLTVASLSRDANVANDAAAATVSVEAGTDLAVALDGPEASELSREFEITIDIANRSSVTASDVSVTAGVASGLTISSAISAGGPCTFSGTAARCEHAAIDAGRRVTATLTALATAAGNHRVDASVQAEQLDLDPADNSASIRVAVAAQAGTTPTVEANSSSGGGGGLLAPGLLYLALLLAGLRRFSRTAWRPSRASDRAWPRSSLPTGARPHDRR
jgi:hypothetical protein